MAPIDIVILLLIAIAFVAVCVRIYRKGTDKVAEDLGRGIK